jgi:hypothetical protein
LGSNTAELDQDAAEQGLVRLFPFLWPDSALFRQDVGAAGHRRSEVRRRQRNDSFPIRQKCFKALSAVSSLSFGNRLSVPAISVKSHKKCPFDSNSGTILLSLRNDFRETPDRSLDFHKSCIPIAGFACCRCCARRGDNIKVISQLTNFKVNFCREGCGCEVAAR